jgi:hypothetical protein
MHLSEGRLLPSGDAGLNGLFLIHAILKAECMNVSEGQRLTENGATLLESSIYHDCLQSYTSLT